MTIYIAFTKHNKNNTAYMIRVPITLEENITVDAVHVPVEVSVPFKRGEIYDVSSLFLTTKQEQKIPCQVDVLALWPDKSLKWARIYFQYSGLESVVYLIDNIITEDLASFNIDDEKHIAIKENANFIEICTGERSFSLHKSRLGVFKPLKHSAESSIKAYESDDSSLVLIDKQANVYYPLINDIRFGANKSLSVPTCKNILKQTLYISGTFIGNNECVAQFSAEVTFYAHQSYTQWRFTLHNPNAMVHDGGKWDLGNENSLYFKAMNAVIRTGDISTSEHVLLDNIALPKNEQWRETLGCFSIFQASSGGENWQSQNHVDHNGNLSLGFRGYEISSTDQNEQIANRATPLVYIPESDEGGIGLSVFIENFWQKYPKAISVEDSQITLGLFPECANSDFELQPGEKKSDTFFISYSDDRNSLVHFHRSLSAKVCPKYLVSTTTIPFYTHENSEVAYNAIVEKGLLSQRNLFVKRELIDEFGWRNFGDIYADHETLECEHEGELISHYNNQYDPLYGLLRQYLLTYEKKWLELANDLADHVVNIDIYHTTRDKGEYNGGLFWHTDHYLPAETASHRTYSKSQKSNAYQDHAGGGGPGGQHCYTTGLMLHYFITGELSSKEAALQLANWITKVYEGSGTFAELLLAIKNKNRKDIKNVFSGKYPLDRGTGHYVIALIDAFELTGKQSYLDHASLIIKNTVNPTDDIEDRELTNVEECWFYTVFFQAVYRYLQVKENVYQLDHSFIYARESLLHYAQWMLKYEQPYLYKPEILEYPNQTWTAQDIRKANILYMASYYCATEALGEQYKSKADDIYNYVVKTLLEEPTSDFTRILSILMQNHGIRTFVSETADSERALDSNTINTTLNGTAKKANLLESFKSTLSNASLSNELNWCRKRIAKLDHLMKSIGM